MFMELLALAILVVGGYIIWKSFGPNGFELKLGWDAFTSWFK